MFTAGQARRLAVARLDVSRLVNDTIIEPVPDAARVYRLVGAPGNPEMDPLRAAWLQLGGDRMWQEATRAPVAIVSHRSAAHARGLGDLIPTGHEFYTSTRLRPSRDDLVLRVRTRLDSADWSLSRGLPVCTVPKIVNDLLREHEDESAVAQIVRDARHDGLLDHRDLRRAADGHARAYGRPSTAELVAALAEGE